MVLTWFDTVMGCFEPDQKSFWNDTWSVVIPACLDSRNTYVGEFISPEKMVKPLRSFHSKGWEAVISQVSIPCVFYLLLKKNACKYSVLYGL